MFPDAREALKDLLNLKWKGDQPPLQPPLEEAAAFIARHGPLRLFDPAIIWWGDGPPADFSDPRMAVVCASGLFKSTIRDVGSEVIRYDNVNGTLSTIFSSAVIDGEKYPTALKVDILAGTVKPVARDLLDALALEFMRSYKNIASCERCQRFFVKEYSNDFYCSPTCGEQSRKESQRDWMRNYRAEQKRKRESKGRKPRRTK